MSKHPYRTRSRLLHWGAAALVLVTLVTSGHFGDVAVPRTDSGNDDHASFGLLLLVLMLVRVWWRTRTLDPLDSYTLPALQRVIARTVHYGLYTLLIAQCLSGLLLSLSGDGVSIFGLITVPALGAGTAPATWLAASHSVMSNVLLGLVALHVTAAVGHLMFGVVPEGSA